MRTVLWRSRALANSRLSPAEAARCAAGWPPRRALAASGAAGLEPPGRPRSPEAGPRMTRAHSQLRGEAECPADILGPTLLVFLE